VDPERGPGPSASRGTLFLAFLGFINNSISPFLSGFTPPSYCFHVVQRAHCAHNPVGEIWKLVGRQCPNRSVVIIMGVFDGIRRRDENSRIMNVFGSSEEKNDGVVGEVPAQTSSLEWQDEKEIQQRPDEVNANASVGLQKAEAAALVYSKRSLILIYAKAFTICLRSTNSPILGSGSAFSSCLSTRRCCLASPTMSLPASRLHPR
jgi:hypothetical protein